MHYSFFIASLIFALMSLYMPLLIAGPIQPDRPGFSTGTSTVKPGFNHIEMGIQSDYANNNEADSYTVALLNYRRGLTENTELNIFWDGWSIVDDEQKSRTVSDMLVGLKHRLSVTDEYNISILGYVSLPTGTDSDTSDTSVFFAFLWDYVITNQISVFGTLQGVSFVEEDQRSNNFQPAVGLSFSHTNTVSTYVEYYHDISVNLDTPQSRMFDAGITYLLTPAIQLDFNAGVSLDETSSDFLGAGIAVRI